MKAKNATIGTPEAARRLGVTAQRVRQLCDEGSVKGEKVGRDWRIKPRAVMEYLRLKGEAAKDEFNRGYKPI